MSKTLLVIIVPIISTIISVVFSIIATTLKNKAELRKVQIEVEKNFAKSLFDKRVEYYPDLYNILSDYAKTIKYGRNNIDNLKEFREKMDDWNSKYSLFFSPQTADFSSRFRYYLAYLLADNIPADIIEKNWEPVLYMIGKFEKFLKSEIGIINIKPIGEVDESEKVDKYITECENSLELELNERGIDSEGNYLRRNKELFKNIEN